LISLECGALTPLSFFSIFLSRFPREKKKEKKESGVKAPHSKVRFAAGVF